jgi:hypothetical protein
MAFEMGRLGEAETDGRRQILDKLRDTCVACARVRTCHPLSADVSGGELRVDPGDVVRGDAMF